jgi:serine/threonine protein kinase
MQMKKHGKRVAVGGKVGKYKLRKRIGDGAFGVVYKAYDEIEGQYVALKIHERSDNVDHILQYFRKEIQLLAKVDHPNVLKLKNADVFDGRLFIVSELGKGSLDERWSSITVKFAVSVLRQMLLGLTEVQKHNIVHRDIKPGNIILFARGVAKLGDFGIAKVVERAGESIGTDAGTRGYFAPEQIYGHPSFASDIFSLGLVFYEMITGVLPRWPFQWPFEGRERFTRRVNPRLRKVIRKALEFEEEDRYPDAATMLRALDSALEPRNGKVAGSRRRMMPWRKYRELEFSTRYNKLLDLKFKCARCKGPISEYMMHCPWCGTDKNGFKGLASFPSVCKRCEHGVKDEWEYCAWCYGGKFKWSDVWVTEDKRYVKRCPNRQCGERKVMRWMQYCPWCHTKLRPWIVRQLEGRCRKCRWSIASDYWDYCAWCGETV